jgi:ribosomal protein S18 acetylase RimI-like enzyme
MSGRAWYVVACLTVEWRARRAVAASDGRLSSKRSPRRAQPELEQITLAVVTTNEAARSLYRSLGFATYGVEPRALKVGERYLDEDLMTLSLC